MEGRSHPARDTATAPPSGEQTLARTALAVNNLLYAVDAAYINVGYALASPPFCATIYRMVACRAPPTDFGCRKPPHEGKSVFANQVSVGVEKPEFGFIVHVNILITCLAAVAFDDLKPDALLFEVMTALRTRASEGRIIEGGSERHGT